MAAAFIIILNKVKKVVGTGGIPTPPVTVTYIIDDDGAYIIDDDGKRLIDDTPA